MAKSSVRGRVAILTAALAMGAAPGPSVSMMVKDLTPMIVTF
jgi:hypothetical protein